MCCDGQMSTREKVACRIVSLLVVLFLIVLLVGLSFSKVDYYEYGFVKNNVAGSIDRTEVFEKGLYFLGPTKSFVTFEAITINLPLSGLSVWSRAAGDDAGTPLIVNVNVQYRLDKTRLEELYAKVGFNYQPFVRNVVTNTIKNNATRFSADEYLTGRLNIEEKFTAAVRAELNAAADALLTNLQLGHVQFPDSYYSRKLDAAMQEQRNQIQDYRKTSTLVRGNTTVQVRQIENEALRIVEGAKADAALIEQQGENQAIAIRGSAERIGLADLASNLNITSQKELLSLNYLVNLKTVGTGRKFVNFAQAPEAKSLLN